MAGICVVAKVTVVEGKRDDALDALSEVMEAVRDEPGTPVYAIHIDRDDGGVLWFYEAYDDEEAMNEHQSTTADLIGKVAQQYAAAEPEIHLLEPKMRKGY